MKDVRLARFCDQAAGDMGQAGEARVKERVIDAVDGAGSKLQGLD